MQADPRPVETGAEGGGTGWGGLQPSQIFAKIDPLTIDSYSEKKNIVKKHKPVQIPRKLLITLPLFTIRNAKN